MKYRLILFMLLISIGSMAQTPWVTVGNGWQKRTGSTGSTEYRVIFTSPNPPYNITEDLGGSFIRDNKTNIPENKRISLLDSIKTTGVLTSGKILNSNYETPTGFIFDNKDPLIGIATFRSNGANSLIIQSDGNLLGGSLAYLGGALFSSISPSINGAVIGRNIADTNPVLSVYSSNATLGIMTDLLDISYGLPAAKVAGVNVLGRFRGTGISNLASANNSVVGTAVTGTLITRNIADANPVLIVNNLNSSSTADLINLKFANAEKFKVDYRGVLGVNGVLAGAGQAIRSNATGVASELYTPLASGDAIQNQNAVAQTANFRITGNGEVEGKLIVGSVVNAATPEAFYVKVAGNNEIQKRGTNLIANDIGAELLSNKETTLSASTTKYPSSSAVVNALSNKFNYGNNGDKNLLIQGASAYVSVGNAAGTAFTRMDFDGYTISNNSGVATKIVAAGTNTAPATVTLRNVNGDIAFTGELNSAINAETLQKVTARGATTTVNTTLGGRANFFGNASAGTDNYIELRTPGNSNVWDIVSANTGNFGISDGAVYRIYVDKASGNVGIGNSAPGSKLSVGDASGSTATPTGLQMDNSFSNDAVGSYLGNKLKIKLYDNGVDRYGFGLDGNGNQVYYAGTTGSTSIHNFYTNGVSRANISSTGIQSSAFNVTSKRSEKENIRTYKGSAVSLINAIKIKSFNYKSDSSKARKIGFIADDTNEIFATKEHDKMDMGSTVGMLLKAIQELHKDVETLKLQLQQKNSDYEKTIYYNSSNPKPTN